MSEIKKHMPGTFCWVDLGTINTDRAKTFYNGLFGWTAVDYPTSDNGTYTMFQVGGKDVAAMYPLRQEQLQQGVPPYWGHYISVENAEAVQKRVESLGGTVLMPAFDVMEHGRMCVVQDPTGATFSAWEPKNHIGTQLVDQPNTLCWSELVTNNVDKAQSFYTSLFGWKAKTSNNTGMTYTEFYQGDKAIGGMMQIQADWGNVPPHWMAYFAVDNCDASLERAQKLGGKIITPAHDIPKVGRFANVQDPQGATFAIIRLNT